MGKINSRAKGKTAERELIGELKKLLPDDMTRDLERNLEQTRGGGHDILGLKGWAPEVKRYAVVLPADMESFWAQATTQARNDRSRPALFFREDRRDWRVVLRVSDITGDENDDSYEMTVQMSMPLFAKLATELADLKHNSWKVGS
jgi:hypothetical protein